MKTHLKNADIDRLVNELVGPYPRYRHKGGVFYIEEVIQQISEEYDARDVGSMLVSLGMLDAEMRPTELMVRNDFATSVSDFDDSSDSNQPTKERFVMTPMGCKFWRMLIQHELQAEQSIQQKYSLERLK